MGITEYISPLKPDEDRLRFELETARGKITRFVVQYETLVNDRWYPVVRYDTAHGFAHKDVLNLRGKVIRKITLGSMDYKQALDVAIDDIKSHWKEYKKEFLKRK